jgi:hypothetical protein
LRKANIELEYLYLLEDNNIDNNLYSILLSINKYLIRTSILFKDFSKLLLNNNTLNILTNNYRSYKEFY